MVMQGLLKSARAVSDPVRLHVLCNWSNDYSCLTYKTSESKVL